MFQLMKDIRRRSMEKIMVTVGATERTLDERFENSYKNFQQMASDLNGAGTNLSQSLLFQKTNFDNAANLAASLSRMYMKNPDMSVEQKKSARTFGEKWVTIHEVLRPSMEMICLDKALKPVSLALSLILPDIDNSVKGREDKLTDFDSCKRRMKALEEKRDAAVADKYAALAAGKQAKSTDEVVAACQKFEFKLRDAENDYNELNDRALKDLNDAKVKSGQLAEQFFITTVVCQCDLFTRAAKELEDLIETLPQDKVEEIRGMINRLVISNKCSM